MSGSDQLNDITRQVERVSLAGENVVTETSNTDELLAVQDAKLKELLNLFDEYENLTNGDYRRNFISGHMNLSRSNFNSELRRFGKDSYDLRPYKACKQIKVESGVFTMVDLLQKKMKKQTKELKENVRKTTEKDSCEGTEQLHSESEVSENEPKEEVDGNENLDRKDKIDELGKDAATELPHASSSLKQRGEKKHEQTHTTTLDVLNDNSAITTGSKSSGNQHEKHNFIDKAVGTNDESSTEDLPLKDPLSQFGSLVPYQLHEAQRFFENGLSNIIDIVNLDTRITKLITEIEELNTKSSAK